MKLTHILSALGIIFALWFFFSWADVISDNNSGNPQHSDLNLFNVLLELTDGVMNNE